MPPGGDDVRRRRNGNRIMVLEWGNPRFTRSRREEGRKEVRKEGRDWRDKHSNSKKIQ